MKVLKFGTLPHLDKLRQAQMKTAGNVDMVVRGRNKKGKTTIEFTAVGFTFVFT
ncbi:MAG: hypothetical protein ACJATE_002170 [Bacteroidia bacterium]